MMKISGRFRQTSTQSPAGMLIQRLFEILISASRRPKISENTIAIRAIWRFTRRPSRRNLKLFPVQSHSQFSELKR